MAKEAFALETAEEEAPFLADNYNFSVPLQTPIRLLTF
jgi:hypothetical protein